MNPARRGMLAASFVVVACSSSSSPSAPPGSSSVDGGSPRDGAPPSSTEQGSKDVTEKPSPDCNDLEQRGELVDHWGPISGQAGSESGPGALKEGIYVLTSSRVYGGAVSGSPSQIRRTVAIVGDRWYAVDGDLASLTRLTRKWTLSDDNYVTFSSVCGRDELVDGNAFVAESSGAGFRLRYGSKTGGSLEYIDYYDRVGE